MQSQLENNIKKTLEGLQGISGDLEKFINDAKNNLQTKEEKSKFAEALEKTNVMQDLKKVTEQFKEALK